MIDNIFIEKAYVISIEGSPSYKEWSARDYVEIFPGANAFELWHNLKNKTKKEWNKAIKDKYGILVKPVTSDAERYFGEQKGAIGCWISHYLLWEKISKQKQGWYLILEDDVNSKDVRSVITKYTPTGLQKLPKPDHPDPESAHPKYTDSPLRETNLINLNSRADNGCEAYCLHSSVIAPILEFVNKTIARPMDKTIFGDILRGVSEITYLHDTGKITLNLARGSTFIWKPGMAD